MERGPIKLLGPERAAYWRGGSIERGAKKRIYSVGGSCTALFTFLDIFIICAA